MVVVGAVVDIFATFLSSGSTFDSHRIWSRGEKRGKKTNNAGWRNFCKMWLKICRLDFSRHDMMTSPHYMMLIITNVSRPNISQEVKTRWWLVQLCRQSCDEVTSSWWHDIMMYMMYGHPPCLFQSSRSGLIPEVQIIKGTVQRSTFYLSIALSPFYNSY